MPICEHCGTGIPVGHKFCYECGYSLDWKAPAGRRPDESPPELTLDLDDSAPPAPSPGTAAQPGPPADWVPPPPPGWQPPAGWTPPPPPPGWQPPAGWGPAQPPPGWPAALYPGLQIALRPENWRLRLVAALIDAALAWVVVFMGFVIGLMVWFAASGRTDEVKMGVKAEELFTPRQIQLLGGILIVSILLVFYLYLTACEGIWGRTLGKRIFRLHVVDRAHGRCGWGRAALRNLFKTPAVVCVPVDIFTGLALALVFGFFIGFVATDGEGRRRLGDRVSGTLVVRALR